MDEGGRQEPDQARTQGNQSGAHGPVGRQGLVSSLTRFLFLYTLSTKIAPLSFILLALLVSYDLIFSSAPSTLFRLNWLDTRMYTHELFSLCQLDY